MSSCSMTIILGGARRRRKQEYLRTKEEVSYFWRVGRELVGLSLV